MSQPIRRLVRLATAAAVLSVASCGESGPALHPVRGTVLFQDQPADGATVVFQPAGGPADAPMPSGAVGPDGTFTLFTHPGGAGAPAGDYLVLVTWLPANAREQANPKNKLPPKYSGLDSPLKATVKPGNNTLDPFKLTK